MKVAKNRAFIRWVIVCAMITGHSIHGYVPQVHQRMTERAVQRIFPDLERHVGIWPTDRVGGELPLDIMSQGSYDEDRIVPDGRSVNHFFDPEHLEPLNVKLPFVGCSAKGERADRWALEAGFGNDYSVARAKTWYAESLLGPNPGTRESAKRELLLALGHAVHLIQDMAQPEHTRNDQHLPGSATGQATAASIWENWGGRNLSSFATAAVSFDGYPTVVLPSYASFFHTYEVVNGRPAGRGMADFSNRSFVTQDTNYHDEDPSWPCRGGTPCFYYTEPRIAESVPRTLLNQSEHIIRFIPDAGGNVVPVAATETVDYLVYLSFPHDFYTHTQLRDEFHTFHSSFDQEARQYGCGPLYSLNDHSYQSRAALLVPRAVGYSAGFIKHFFRGDVDVQWSPNPLSGGYYMKITNKSTETVGSDATVEAVFKATSAYFDRTNRDDTGLIVRETRLRDLVSSFDGLSPGESVTVNVTPFGLKSDDSLLEFERKIVVRGTLGTEHNAVIGLHQLPSLKTRRTLNFNRPGTTPYFELANYGGVGVYFVSHGANAFLHPSLQATSGVYMNAYRGGSFTFVWHQEAFASRFRLINGDRETRVSVRTSTNVYFDERTFFDVVMAPFEERTIELPEGTERFTVGSSAGWVAIDDVSWEYVVP